MRAAVWALLVMGLCLLYTGLPHSALAAGEVVNKGGEIFDNEKLLAMIKAGTTLDVIEFKVKNSLCKLNGNVQNLNEIQVACKESEWTKENISKLQILVMKEAGSRKGEIKNMVDQFMNVAINWDAPEYDAAMRGMVREGSELVPELLKHIEEENPLKRKAVLDGLAHLNDKTDRVVNNVILMLQDREPGVRAQAAQTIAALAGPNTFETVLEKMKSKQNEFQDGLVMALGYLENQKAVPVLVDLLKNSENKDARLSAAWALGNMRAKDPEARDELLKAILDPNDFRLRSAAAEAAGLSGDLRAKDYIFRAIERYSGKEGKMEMIDKLKYQRHIRSVEFLLNFLRDDNPDIRKCANDTLKVLTGEKNNDAEEEWRTWLDINKDRPDWIDSDKKAPREPKVTSEK